MSIIFKKQYFYSNLGLSFLFKPYTKHSMGCWYKYIYLIYLTRLESFRFISSKEPEGNQDILAKV